MNEIVNKFLLAGDKFMPEMHLKQPFYKNELDKSCFQHDMAYGDFKDLKRGTASDKILRDNAFNIAKNPKYDGYQRGLASMVYKFFDKKSTGNGIFKNNNNNDDTKQKLQLAKELHKPIIRKF